ncbi:MAG TPA: molybdopterin-dependent oxidoreductase [Candidatus Binatia bacterium]|nr:molybdopterin-dependent oxidoreductase [Candidatus Binatia bacterium]
MSDGPQVHSDDKFEQAGAPKSTQPASSEEAPNPEPLFGPAGEEVQRITPRERRRINRRELLKLVPVVALGAFAIPKLRERLLMNGQELSDWASGKLFGRHRLAQTFSDRDVVPFERFPYNYYHVLDPEVDLDHWTLKVEGLVRRPGEYRLQQIRALPKLVQNTRHVCVEGWDVIGNFGGTRASDFLHFIGADLTARYLEVECADNYYESIDMETVLHPQTLLCYEMYGKPLDRGHGAPLRLQMPTKIGYKQAKYLNTMRVTNVLQGGMRGYWEDQGYSWYGGL